LLDGHGVPKERSAKRLGWLLRSNRTLGEDATFHSARKFADAFRCRAAPALPPSQITRWETGKIAVENSIIDRYESLLGLPTCDLSIVHEVSSTFLDGPPLPAHRPDGDDALLHELLDRSRCPGSMDGRHWRRLTSMINSRPGLLLHPPGMWRAMADTLLHELVVSEQKSWFIRQEAMTRLLAHPASAHHAVEACVDLADDVSNPVSIEPISLLDAANHPTANRYVMSEVCEPRTEQSLQGALLAATSKLRRGHLTLHARAVLAEAAADLGSVYEHHPAIGPLVAELNAALKPSTSKEPDETRKTCALRIALDAQSQFATASAEPDHTLIDLLDEALFSHNADGRLYATALIAATPYRQPVAGAVTRQLLARATTHDNVFVERGLRLVGRLRATTHHEIVRRLLQAPAASAHTRHAAAWASSHNAGRLDETTWRAIIDKQIHVVKTRPSPLDDDILRGLVYSVGTAAHFTLLTELTARPEIPLKVRQLARWWHLHGGVLLH
jgi:hypothetical protein